MIEINTIQLWTHHPKKLRIDNPNLVIDPSQGMYWNDPDERRRIRYQEMLRLFQNHVGTDQFLWCCVERGMYVDLKVKLIEWELNIQDSSRVIFFNAQLWDAILDSEADDWSGLFVGNMPVDLEGLSAIALLPLKKEWITERGAIKLNNHPILVSSFHNSSLSQLRIARPRGPQQP